MQQQQNLKQPTVALPDKFNGDRKAFRGFINQLRMLFTLNSQIYHSDELKVFTTGTLLSGKALYWFNPIVENPTQYQEIISSFERFLESFSQSFSPINQTRQATNQIRHLRQNRGPASSYASEFRQIASDLRWNEEALKAQYYLGLSDEVKDMLVNFPEVPTLDGLITLSIKCDQRLFERKQTKKQFHAFPAATSVNHSVTTEATPMEIDSMKRQSLTKEERDHRMQNGLCIVCGEPGHFKKDCPKAFQNQLKGQGQ